MSFIRIDIHGKLILTGDVHHRSLKTNDQGMCGDLSEIDLCTRYLEIANKYQIAPILFMTGRAVSEEGDKIRCLASSYCFEVGGHSYFANSPRLLYSAYRRFRKGQLGPKFWQNLEIHLTKRTIKKHLGIDIRIWRGHGYAADRYTIPLLLKHKISCISNKVDKDCLKPSILDSGMTCVSINTIVDHENLGHYDKTNGLSISEWKQRALIEASEIVGKGGTAVMLIHPCCMYIEDRFSSYSEICKRLSRMMGDRERWFNTQ